MGTKYTHTRARVCVDKHTQGWRYDSSAQLCSPAGRVLDWHAAEAGSIPRFDKGFFSQSQLLVQTLVRRPYTCAHVQDPVVHARVRGLWKH